MVRIHRESPASPSSRGLGHHPFKVEIAGSNPAGGTTSRLQSHQTAQETRKGKLSTRIPLRHDGGGNWLSTMPVWNTACQAIPHGRLTRQLISPGQAGSQTHRSSPQDEESSRATVLPVRGAGHGKTTGALSSFCYSLRPTLLSSHWNRLVVGVASRRCPTKEVKQCTW